ncbi:MAG: hypothetical protein HGA76_01145 [Candidatus Firestonebacteria bacterium]|nr:hypothetical protein [Candidatus Firestonebacteria bacterium]
MSAIRLDRKGITMLGYGIVDVEITRNNVWRAVIEPVLDGQYTLKLKDLINKVIQEPEARDIYQEILNYKWLQTENLVNEGQLEEGSSLTLQVAAKEWMEKHYPDWKAARPTLREVTDHDENVSAPGEEERR